MPNLVRASKEMVALTECLVLRQDLGVTQRYHDPDSLPSLVEP